MNITKFGAFVNILPGRDGLLHISKMGGGKRINSVDDVLELGQEIQVKVEEIDDKGKVSLMLAEELEIPEGAASSGGGGGDRGGREDRPRRDRDSGGRGDRGGRGDGGGRGGRDSAPAPAADSDVVEVSFEDSFDAELAGELGDLGPKGDRPKEDGGNRGGGGGRRRHR